MHDGSLNHALKAKRGLRIHLATLRNNGCVVGDELAQMLAQFISVGRASFQHFNRCCIIKQGEKQVFDGDEFVTRRTRFDECHVQTNFEFLGNHISSRCF
jgi:hypothetical protein